MRAQLLLLSAGVVGGFAIGWITAPSPRPVPAVAADMPSIAHASAEARDARELLARLGLATPVVVDAGPPPPDIAVLFRRDLTAIEELPVGRVAWIVDYGQTYRRRALGVGDVYQDGWRISRIGVQTIELRRRRETRTVDAFALPVIEP